MEGILERFNQLSLLQIYREKFLNQLSSSASILFWELVFTLYGHHSKAHRPSIKELTDRLGRKDQCIKQAIRDLESAGILIVIRGRGRGKKNEYDFNFDIFKTSENHLLNKTGEKKLFKKEGFHGSEETILISNQPLAEPSAEPPVTPEIKKSDKKKSGVNKYTEQEHKICDRFFQRCEKISGEIEKDLKPKEYNAYWKLFERIKRKYNGSHIPIAKRLFLLFFEVVEGKIKELKYMEGTPARPSRLYSSGAWTEITNYFQRNGMKDLEDKLQKEKQKLKEEEYRKNEIMFEELKEKILKREKMSIEDFEKYSKLVTVFRPGIPKAVIEKDRKELVLSN